MDPHLFRLIEATICQLAYPECRADTASRDRQMSHSSVNRPSSDSKLIKRVAHSDSSWLKHGEGQRGGGLRTMVKRVVGDANVCFAVRCEV